MAKNKKAEVEISVSKDYLFGCYFEYEPTETEKESNGLRGCEEYIEGRKAKRLLWDYIFERNYGWEIIKIGAGHYLIKYDTKKARVFLEELKTRLKVFESSTLSSF